VTTPTASRASSSLRDGRLAIALLGLMFLPAGLQAAFFPRSFYDDFPLGRGWIVNAGGAYNEHLVRDVGGLFLALAIVSLWAWFNVALCRPVAVAWLAQGVLHFVFHARHLSHFDGFDKVALMGSLVAAPLLAGVALVTTGRGTGSS
jgi:hypothetical protein